MKTKKIDWKKLNRVEVIDWSLEFDEGGGRVYSKWENDIKIFYELQDTGRTLKIFIEKLEERN